MTIWFQHLISFYKSPERLNLIETILKCLKAKSFSQIIALSKEMGCFLQSYPSDNGSFPVCRTPVLIGFAASQGSACSLSSWWWFSLV